MERLVLQVLRVLQDLLAHKELTVRWDLSEKQVLLAQPDQAAQRELPVLKDLQVIWDQQAQQVPQVLQGQQVLLALPELQAT